MTAVELDAVERPSVVQSWRAREVVWHGNYTNYSTCGIFIYVISWQCLNAGWVVWHGHTVSADHDQPQHIVVPELNETRTSAQHHR